MQNGPGSGRRDQRVPPQTIHGVWPERSRAAIATDTRGVSSDTATIHSMPSTTRPALSIVTSMFRSAEYIDEFCRRCAAAAAGIADSYEIVIVNDGSPDDSLTI